MPKYKLKPSIFPFALAVFLMTGCETCVTNDRSVSAYDMNGQVDLGDDVQSAGKLKVLP